MRIFRCYCLLFAMLGVAGQAQATVSGQYTRGVKACVQNGWRYLSVKSGVEKRDVLWKRPRLKWKHGALVVFHSAGQSYDAFCADDDRFEAQSDFAEAAVQAGFAVFLLDADKAGVVDARGQRCTKQFDAVLVNRPNHDLAFVETLITSIIPQLRPGRSSKNIYLAGGMMAVRAASQFNDKVTAFAAVAAADPFGSVMNCRTGVVSDADTGKKLFVEGACKTQKLAHDKKWPKRRGDQQPAFKLFHDDGDAVVDISCMKKLRNALRQQGYQDRGDYIINSFRRRKANHLWQDDYNDAMIDFFKNP